MQRPLAFEDATKVPQRKGHSIALGKGLRLAFENPREGRAVLYRGDFPKKTVDLGDKVARKLFITELMELGANQSQRRMPMPGRTNQVTCDGSGRIVDFEIQEGKGEMKHWILDVVDQWRPQLSAPPVSVFDREGYDAGFFFRLVSDGKPFVSWEKNVDAKRPGAIEAQRFATDFTFNAKCYSVFEQPKAFTCTDAQGEKVEVCIYALRISASFTGEGDKKVTPAFCAIGTGKTVGKEAAVLDQLPRCSFRAHSAQVPSNSTTGRLIWNPIAFSADRRLCSMASSSNSLTSPQSAQIRN